MCSFSGPQFPSRPSSELLPELHWLQEEPGRAVGGAEEAWSNLLPVTLAESPSLSPLGQTES